MKFPSLTLALAVGVALVVVPVAGAQAAAPVTIRTIPGATVKFENTKTFKPRFVKQQDVQIDKAVLKVVQRGKVIAKDRTSIRLGKGSYTVRQAVTYRMILKPGNSEPATLPAGSVVDAACTIATTGDRDATTGSFTANCRPVPAKDTKYTQTFVTQGTWADVPDEDDETSTPPRVTPSFADSKSTVTLEKEFFEEEAIVDVRAITTSSVVEGVRTIPAEVGPARTLARAQKLTVRSLKEPKGCVSIAEYRSVKARFDYDSGSATGDRVSTVTRKLHTEGKRRSRSVEGSSSLEIRRYRSCTAGTVVDVTYYDGRAGDKYRGSASKSPDGS